METNDKSNRGEAILRRRDMASAGTKGGSRKNRLTEAVGFASLALLGAVPALVQAQEDLPLEEITVTASYRSQDPVDIPYNISVVDGEFLQRNQIFSMENLMDQVPNLNMNATSNANITARKPVIRGLNASISNQPGAVISQEQSPVAIFVNNSYYGGFFPVKDVQRVEVLRGPQGTLYGAGSLGGTVRIVTNLPDYEKFSGSVEGIAAVVDHSDDLDSSVGAVLNIPLADTLALRMSARSERWAGFIDQRGTYVRENGPGTAPVLANPGDVANSPGIKQTIEDVNAEEVDSFRIALGWRPNDRLEVVGAIEYADFQGNLGPNGNPEYQGGVDPFDGDTIGALGDYEVYQRGDSPYERDSTLGTLDATFDMGFATLTSATSVFDSEGDTWLDGTWTLSALGPGLLAYYAGSPFNPRFVTDYNFLDEVEGFTQEFRLVSKPGDKLSYIVGAYYQDEEMLSIWDIFVPGTAAQNAASPGGYDIPFVPNEQSLAIDNNLEIEELSFYGELTWHVTEDLDITAGARHYRQDVKRTISNDLPLFGLSGTGENDFDSSDTFYKLNASFSLSEDSQIYGTFSQGFRRAGVNSWPLEGLLAEPTDLIEYDSDTADNFEIGIKGVAGSFRYQANLFYVDWDAPQIGTTTPHIGWPAVLNGEAAESKGIELEVSGRLTDSLSLSVGYAFADATLTEDFCIATNFFGAGLDPCAIQGTKGDRLPGAPENSGNLSLLYEKQQGERLWSANLTANYRGSMQFSLPVPSNPRTLQSLDAYWVVNAVVSVDQGPWQLSLRGLNLFDERGVISLGRRDAGEFTAGLDRNDTIIRPRSIGLGLRYQW